jgi:hypothetical protein
MPRRVWSLLGAVLCHATSASAGVVLIMEQSGGRDPAPVEIRILAEPDRLKLPNARGGVIYRGDQDKAWTIDDERKSYIEITRQSAGEIRSQMEAAMAQARAQLPNLPPEQRKAVEEMLAKQGAGVAPGQQAKPPAVTFQKAGGKKTVGKWSCEGYARLEDGRKVDDLCVARLADLGLTRNDLKAFSGLSGLVQSAAGPGRAAARPMDFEALSKAIGYDAMPIHSVHHNPGGAAPVETTVKAIERKPIAPASFELPAGYAKRDLMQPPPQPRR